MIRMDLFEIRIDETTQEQLIVLKEHSGNRLLHIVIGFYEAQAIHTKISGHWTPRPMTHDLLKNTIESLGGKLDKIYINDLMDNTFYARLHIEIDGKIVEVDSRPSDAIALAVRSDIPIFVAEKEVLDKVQQNY